MTPIPSNRVYFHYNHFNNVDVSPNKSTTKIWEDPNLKHNKKGSLYNHAGGDRRPKIADFNNLFPSRNTHVVVIGISTKTNSREKGTRVASSLEQLVKSLRKDKIGASFNGTFIIKDVGHRTVSSNTKTLLSQRKGVMPKSGNRKRLPKSAYRSVRDIERALLCGGYLQASYVDGNKI